MGVLILKLFILMHVHSNSIKKIVIVSECFLESKSFVYCILRKPATGFTEQNGWNAV